MTRCVDVRWRLTAFLMGSLGEPENEVIRGHLDQCPKCAGALADEERLSAITPEEVSAPDSFVVELLSRLPEPTVSTVMFRYLCGVFAASSTIGVSIYAFWRHFAHPGRPLLLQLSWDGLGNMQTSFPWLQKIAADPIFNFSLLALLATGLTVGLIIVVDLPRRRRLGPIRYVERIRRR